MELNKEIIILFKNKKVIMYLILIFMILIILSILAFIKIVNYTFITGYLLASCFLYFSFIFMKFAIRDLTNSLNPYNYVFFSILRAGFYIVPFLISFYLPDIFNVYGLLIGFVINWIPLVFIHKQSK
ncbi:MG406 family protein [Spiroplasma diminutum]|uniref:ATP synthase protein I n=1 Tax=Spiroplasma diminutum CUAS-1 TaxID=1276221 RepID=S5MDF6_9MOLU|nr:hypothetical protein SDIMI_v3c00490 [Spiroplasma diminutum CUAS-1]